MHDKQKWEHSCQKPIQPQTEILIIWPPFKTTNNISVFLTKLPRCTHPWCNPDQERTNAVLLIPGLSSKKVCYPPPTPIFFNGTCQVSVMSTFDDKFTRTSWIVYCKKISTSTYSTDKWAQIFPWTSCMWNDACDTWHHVILPCTRNKALVTTYRGIFNWAL